MATVSGGCHCGNFSVALQLTRAPDSYSPRACDCDFCRKHGAAYVSDPHGTLHISITDPAQAGRYRQGSAQAEMLVCRQCGVVLGALFTDGARRYATVNARVLDPAVQLGAETVVSPRTLSASEKAARWPNIWFANVSISSPDA
ncbi:MAG TPA: hypothetical protein VET66_08795 [Steroidobacteraceae bacterium]|nr:hypothetical protein [Steroidobacteraceae bacterium]